MDLTVNIKCKVCGSFESTSIDEFRLHGINHCIPSIARYFGVTLEQLFERQQLLQQQKRDNDQLGGEEYQQQDLNKKTHQQNNKVQLSSSTTMTLRFKSLIGSPFIRSMIFGYVKELNNIDGVSYSGTDIIKLPHLEMISRCAMPWNFIKHYLPPRDDVLSKRRWYVISRYCAHRNATLSTLQHLLEWSPDYDPQDQYESVHQELFYNVAIQGHTDIMEFLLKRYPNIVLNGKYGHSIDDASERGHFSMVKLLCSIKGLKCTTQALDNAAKFDHLDIVKYLDQNRNEGCTSKALDSAAMFGRLDIVKYLHFNRTEGCTTNAMDGAALNGHLNVMEWLNYNRKEGVTKQAMDLASQQGHFQIVKWLESRNKGCTTNAMDNAKTLEIFQFLEKNGKRCTSLAMDNACLKGDLDFVKYIHFNRNEGCYQQAVINACNSGNFELIKFILLGIKECPPQAVDSAIEKDCSLEIIEYLGQECTSRGMEYAIIYGRLDVIQYFHKKYPKSNVLWSRNTLNLAATFDKLDIVKFIHENRSEGCTTDAMDNAKNIEVTKFLHFNRSEGCTTKAMDNAAIRFDLETVTFLHKHRTEGCTKGAIRLTHPDIYKYILSNKIMSRESIEKHYVNDGSLLSLLASSINKREDFYEIVEAVNQYYGFLPTMESFDS
ncbi:hypothetical protein DFA_04120 [Cavenderia fasciculata]|uniref:Ankyrin repeat-containing protein n=1 Tax=Cavenderia fasciculata TaxID=261658 RepID=F4Q1C4_CACFS|nr:uncharacterized protein DFA_04120 [Cavenderia fasciculata]EGG18625.1 hypothetical protein DFA_04120 [Cavenderia fasciculata]|eukprot:XP_004366529.1 hypothetical protein DFA_04120 [Cavenderia fasciculata]